MWEAPLEGDISWLCRWLLLGRMVTGEQAVFLGRRRGFLKGPPFSWLKQDAPPPLQTDSLPLSEHSWETVNQIQDGEETRREFMAAPPRVPRAGEPGVHAAPARALARGGRGMGRCLLRKSWTSPESAGVLLSRVRQSHQCAPLASGAGVCRLTPRRCSRPRLCGSARRPWDTQQRWCRSPLSSGVSWEGRQGHH